MHVVRLSAGELAPPEADCVTIEQRDDGRFVLNGTALMACGDTEEAESISMIGSEPYSSYDDAEAAGLAWAADHCAGEVYVSTLWLGGLPI
ncbi:hypothetical protein KZ810_07115 [Sphingomonas sp. RHCKR47]|uniref:hypothetical protein n=1 Tax=Sphingomonas citricola TaxID=2862498 RepID=UPI001CA4E38A|nr:hypothetical protein [Sphingomonas citricola]MBW6523267.1 hypothetical protein [Sphingomonas citricola]